MGKHWDWAPLFLVALERSGLIRASARSIGVGRRTVYDRRERDPEFAAFWDATLAPYRDGSRVRSRAGLDPPAKHGRKPIESRITLYGFGAGGER